MALYVISDLHILDADDPLYFSLLRLLRERAVSGDVVVLAGDLFDLFIGTKQVFKRRYIDFFNALREASDKGVDIHYIEGNHDFLMAPALDGIQRLNVYSLEAKLEIEGKRFYFAHGDTVDSKDYGYRFLRAFFRSFFMRIVITLLPGKWVERIGEASSQKSSGGKPRLARELPLQRMEYLRNIYRSYAAERLAEGHDFVVMGHCHDLDEMSFNVGERRGQYVNVGFPRVHGSFLSWLPGEERIQREKLPS
jgi:UDP-2,3-diacylglucosamine hydrolase